LEGIVDLGALPAEVARRGLVRRDNSFTSRYRGVCWDKKSKKWQARVVHDGKREYLGLFATEGEAKARCDARCLELGQDQDAGTSSAFRGVGWDKATSKWNASIKVDGKNKGLGRFEATARGEVYAALAFDVAARAAGRPEKANFEPAERARGPHGGSAQRPASQNLVMPNTETVAGTDMNGVAEETAPPGSICSAAEAPEPRKGVSWNAAQSKWEAEITHGGRQQYCYFDTEEEANTQLEARCRELGIEADLEPILKPAAHLPEADHAPPSMQQSAQPAESQGQSLSGPSARAAAGADTMLGTGEPDSDAVNRNSRSAADADTTMCPEDPGPPGSTVPAARAPEEDAPDPGALAVEVERRGLVRRDNSFTSRYRGVNWHKKSKKWQARVVHGGKQEYLGRFATEGEAKARCDARCLELGLDPNVGKTSAFCGVAWDKHACTWKVDIRIDGKHKYLGPFEGTARGEVDAALAFDAAARVAGRPEKANSEPAERARGLHGGSAQRPASQNLVMPNTETVAGTEMNGVTEGPVPPGSICSAAEAPEPRKGVSWNAAQSKWEAEIKIRSKFDQNSQVDPAV
jgi:hypothetical protein